MPFRADVQIRYRHTPVPGLVESDGGNGVRVTMDEPQRAVTRGQSVVFYRDDLVLGGAVITGASALK
jgi:tRNA-specific 2-thiouridylase